MHKFSYTQPPNVSPIPIYSFHIRNIRKKNLKGTYDAILDTGADCTLVSFSLMTEIRPITTTQKRRFKVLGKEVESLSYRLEISLDGAKFEGLKVYACSDGILDSPILLGRNYLNRYLIEFDGPKKTVRIHD